MNYFSNFFLFFCKEEVKTPLFFFGLNVYVQYVLVFIKKKTFVFIHACTIYQNKFSVPMDKICYDKNITNNQNYLDIFKKWQLLDTCSYFKNKKNIVEKLFYFHFFSWRTNFSILFLFFFPPPHQIIWKIFRKSKNKKMLALWISKNCKGLSENFNWINLFYWQKCRYI